MNSTDYLKLSDFPRAEVVIELHTLTSIADLVVLSHYCIHVALS
jgi:hypothetical protein